MVVELERERTVKSFRIQLERERKKQDLIMPSMSAGAKIAPFRLRPKRTSKLNLFILIIVIIITINK